MAELDLCKEVERKVHGHGAMLHGDIVGIKNQSSQVMTMAGVASAAKETAMAEQDKDCTK